METPLIVDTLREMCSMTDFSNGLLRQQQLSPVMFRSETHIQQRVALRWFMPFLASRRQRLASISTAQCPCGLHEVVLFGRQIQ